MMFCSSCGERSGGRCAKCGRISDRTWVMALGAVSWIIGLGATFLYLWKLFPTVVAMFAGANVELLPITQWHVRLTTGWMALVLLLGSIALLLFAWRGSRRALLTLSVSGVLMVAVSFVGIMSALLSIVLHYPSATRLVVHHLRLSEQGSIALLTGDTPKAVVTLKMLHDMRTDPASWSANTCVASSAASAFLLGEAYQRSGDEPRAQEMYRSAEERMREDCFRGTEEGKALTAAIRQRLETAPKTP